jgi:anti-anti-sigma factor
MPFEKDKHFGHGRLKVHTDIYEGMPVLVVVGECDPHSVVALRAAFDYAVENKTTQLIVNIRAMDYIDASGYHALVDGRRRLEEFVGTMVVVDLCPPTERIIKLLELDALMTIVNTMNQAMLHIKRYPLRPAG